MQSSKPKRIHKAKWGCVCAKLSGTNEPAKNRGLLVAAHLLPSVYLWTFCHFCAYDSLKHPLPHALSMSALLTGKYFRPTVRKSTCIITMTRPNTDINSKLDTH
mmetsp:Transcript_12472/g.28918  ORF Transcript_12472/g.28918 Transcript_12472/m.28918 type:complete len:104 (+) Transcript_12472:148-459(+)